MKQFEVGKVYATRSIGNQDCIFAYEVIGRTACTIKIKDRLTKTVKTCRISKKYSQYEGAECILPEGEYSFCPIIRANHTINNMI